MILSVSVLTVAEPMLLNGEEAPEAPKRKLAMILEIVATLMYSHRLAVYAMHVA